MSETPVAVKWLHAPGHAGSVNKDVIEFAIKLDSLIIDWSEMYWNVDELRKFGEGYNHFIGKPKKKDDRGRVVNHDVVISTRKDAKVIHDEEFFVSSQVSSNLKYMPTRYGKARVIKFKGQTILIIAWHPQPNPTHPARIKEVLPRYRRGVTRVQEVQDRLEKKFKPDLVLNGGDLQLGPGQEWIYPNQYAKRNKMSFRRNQIDWQMWRGKGFKFGTFRKRDASKINPGIDHLWTVLVVKK